MCFVVFLCSISDSFVCVCKGYGGFVLIFQCCFLLSLLMSLVEEEN